MAQSSGPIAQGSAAERQFTDAMWRDLFGDEAGVLGDLDGSAYRISLPPDSDVASVGSSTQPSLARVAGFVHRIPQGQPEGVSIPGASGSGRTDIIGLRYDPSFTGVPGPVRLTRIAGTSAGLPAYDASPPGVEELPLWAVTRQPGQPLSQATVRDLRSRLAPVLSLPSVAPLPSSSPLGTRARWGGVDYVRELAADGTPAWVSVAGRRTVRVINTIQGWLALGAGPAWLSAPRTLPAAPHGRGVPYVLRIDASVRLDIPGTTGSGSTSGGGGAILEVVIGSTTVEVARVGNAAPTAVAHTLRGIEQVEITSDAAVSVRAQVRSVAGTLITYPTGGRVIYETSPAEAL